MPYLKCNLISPHKKHVIPEAQNQGTKLQNFAKIIVDTRGFNIAK
jgi:hypothetical protein